MLKNRLIKRSLSLILAFAVLLATGVGCDKIVPKELGIPTKARFDKGIYARTAWDMIVWDNKLYVGSGDYNANKGPTDIWCYDLSKKMWYNSGRLEDESIMRFCTIGGELVAPGIDPKSIKWDAGEEFNGNYYKLDGNSWKTFNVLPSAIHNFDILEHDGVAFAGIGIESGAKAAAYSVDGGQTFTAIEFKKNGEAVDTAGSSFIRAYELFELDGEIYALLRHGESSSKYEIYRYDGKDFVFFSDWTKKIYGGQVTFNFFSAKANYKGRNYFAYGNLFVTNDMDNVKEISLEEGIIVCDMFVKKDILYLLCVKKVEEEYEISVWKNESGKDNEFIEQIHFKYQIPALSFASDGENLYFGVGSRSKVHDKNGMILTVKYAI